MAKPNNYVQRLRKALAGTPLAPYAAHIANTEKRFDIPKGLISSIAKAETSYGTDGAGPSIFNAWGWMTGNGPPDQRAFPNWKTAITKYGQFLSEDYIQAGYNTPEKIMRRYVGSNAPTWLNNVNEGLAAVGGGGRQPPQGRFETMPYDPTSAPPTFSNPIYDKDSPSPFRFLTDRSSPLAKTLASSVAGTTNVQERISFARDAIVAQTRQNYFNSLQGIAPDPTAMLDVFRVAQYALEPGSVPASSSITEPPKSGKGLKGGKSSGSFLKFSSVGGDHPTSGLGGYPALDYMSAGGTPFYAPYTGKVIKISGHPGLSGSTFGRSVYLQSPNGKVTSFFTHLDWNKTKVKVGQVLQEGQLLGYIGNWPGDPGRSHLHWGISGADQYDYINRAGKLI